MTQADHPHLISVVIVDDEAAPRVHLRELLRRMTDDFRVVGEASSLAEAIVTVNSQRPSLVFLDVNMPGGTGFDLLPRLRYAPKIVFVTGYDAYAVRAFELNAVDYLLKPIVPDRLQLTLQRVRTILQTSEPAHALEPATTDQEIVLQCGTSLHRVDVNRISCVKAEGNYTYVHVDGSRPILVRRSMNEWQEILTGDQFFRPHRSLILNLTAVREFHSLTRDGARVRIGNNGPALTVGRRAAMLLRRLLRTSRPNPT